MKSLKSLAKELGVSTAAVSYVYHDKWKEKRISESLAMKIREALEREGVHPNLAGIQLKTGRSMSVGILLPDFKTPHWMEILKGVESVMTPSGLLMLLANTRIGEAEEEALRNVVSRGVDGLIMSPYFDTATFKETLAQLGRDVPIVFVDTYLKDSGIDFVATDNRLGAMELAKGLLSAGRRRIAYLGAARQLSALQERFDGYCKAFELFGLPIDNSLVRRTMSGTEGLPAALSELLASSNPPDAFFMESLSYFKPGFELLSARGLRIPEDIMLAGFDSFDADWLGNSSIDSRSILRAEQDGEAMGRLAASRLKELINNRNGATGRLELFIPPRRIGARHP